MQLNVKVRLAAMYSNVTIIIMIIAIMIIIQLQKTQIIIIKLLIKIISTIIAASD